MMVRAAWIAVAAVTVLRFAFAASLPMTGDEAYYWEWSRRLALGYIDHPPAVAYTIAAFGWLGKSAFVLRLPFVLCGAGTIGALAAAAYELWRTRESAAIAALAAALAPILNVTAVTVSPEGPAALGWACTLWFGLRAFRERTVSCFLLLGVAMGGALLSHFLCWALTFGIVAAATMVPQHRPVWRGGLWISFAVAAAIYAPFVAWNAMGNWPSFAFAVLNRHPSDEVQFTRPLLTYALGLAAFSPGLWVAATIATRRPGHAIIAYTAIPLSIALLVIAVHERVEAYWFEGPFFSLCVALPATERSFAARAWTFAPAVLMSGLLFAAGIAPLQLYGAAQRMGLHLRNAGPFEIFTYAPLAAQVQGLAKPSGALVMTDGYGFSSLLDFYAGIRPVYIGYDAQGQEARRWFTEKQDAPALSLFLDKAPLQQRPDFQKQLARACRTVRPGPVFQTQYRVYYSTWCLQMRSDGIAILRFTR